MPYGTTHGKTKNIHEGTALHVWHYEDASLSSENSPPGQKAMGKACLFAPERGWTANHPLRRETTRQKIQRHHRKYTQHFARCQSLRIVAQARALHRL